MKSYKYKQRVIYYYEFLAYCSIGAYNQTFLMYATECSHSALFHRYFDPMVKGGYLKKSEAEPFKNKYTITEKGQGFLAELEVLFVHLRTIEGEDMYPTRNDIIQNLENVKKLFIATERRLNKQE